MDDNSDCTISVYSGEKFCILPQGFEEPVGRNDGAVTVNIGGDARVSHIFYTANDSNINGGDTIINISGDAYIESLTHGLLANKNVGNLTVNLHGGNMATPEFAKDTLEGETILNYNLDGYRAPNFIYFCSVFDEVNFIDNSDTSHTHVFDGSVEPVEPNCTRRNVQIIHCSHPDCSAVQIVGESSATGHNYIIHESVDSSCTSRGWIEYECTSCGNVITEATPLGHYFGAWTITSEATALKSGVQSRRCSKCGEVETAAIEFSTSADDLTSVSVSGIDSATMSVTTTVLKGIAADKYVAAVNALGNFSKVLDIKIVKSDGKEAEGLGEVQISIPHTSELKKLRNLALYYVDSKGAKTQLKHSINNGVITVSINLE
jgi:hypothetical protein